MKCIIPLKPFYYIRHGESEWNTLGKFAGGQIDTPLTEKGRRQAENTKTVFNALDPAPTHIFHSYLSRARDTATIINKDRQIPMFEKYNLREVDAGEWEGMQSYEARQKWAQGLSPNSGENLDQLACRINEAFSEVLNEKICALPLIAAHGRLLNGLDHLLGFEQRNLQTENCQLMYFDPVPGRKYPWNVYILTIKNGQIHKELADWSQI